MAIHDDDVSFDDISCRFVCLSTDNIYIGICMKLAYAVMKFSFTCNIAIKFFSWYM